LTRCHLLLSSFSSFSSFFFFVVPYATVLDTFLISNHVMILAVGFGVMFFSFLFAFPESALAKAAGGYQVSRHKNYLILPIKQNQFSLSR
jgi:hypothetical protein